MTTPAHRDPETPMEPDDGLPDELDTDPTARRLLKEINGNLIEVDHQIGCAEDRIVRAKQDLGSTRKAFNELCEYLGIKESDL